MYHHNVTTSQAVAVVDSRQRKTVVCVSVCVINGSTIKHFKIKEQRVKSVCQSVVSLKNVKCISICQLDGKLV